MIRSGPKRGSAVHFEGGVGNVGEAVRAVPELGGDELLKERMLRATGDGNVASIGERDERERVLQALRCGHVAGNHGQRSNVELGRIQREEDGNRVVGAGIGVDDDFAGSGGLRCGRGQGGDEATADQEKCECLGRHTH